MGRVERFVAEDSDEIVWLRLNRFKSVKLCEVVLKEKLEEKAEKKIDENLIHRKAIGLSSAIESAIGYWKSKTQDLNSKVLSRYYALLQMTIGEQVSSISNADDLSTVQRHTEQGHGLGSISDPQGSFPANYYVFIMKSGHFHAYSDFLGYKTDKISFQKRPRDFTKMSGKENLIPLCDLFRRIPELRPVIWEHLGVPPLSFHIAYKMERPKEPFKQTIGEVFGAQTDKDKTTCTSRLRMYPESEGVSLDYMESADLPFTHIEEVADDNTAQKHFEVLFEHPPGFWHHHLSLYSSAYCGTSYVVPLLQTIEDPVVLNFVLLYGLSIIVRYMPDLWYKIDRGELNHIGSLIDYYLSVFDHVMPLKMLERITEKRIIITMPGSLFAPI